MEYGPAQWGVGPRTQIEGSLGKGQKHLPTLEKLRERLEGRLTLISLKLVVMSVLRRGGFLSKSEEIENTC